MQIWQDEDQFTQAESGGCCGLSAVDDARRVADRLEIPYYVMNFKREFKKNVMDYFTAEYLKGRTPNPCIACNRYVKWESLLQRSLEIGADYIATGHYARVEQLSNGRYAIRNSVTAAKDIHSQHTHNRIFSTSRTCVTPFSIHVTFYLLFYFLSCSLFQFTPCKNSNTSLLFSRVSKHPSATIFK